MTGVLSVWEIVSDRLSLSSWCQFGAFSCLASLLLGALRCDRAHPTWVVARMNPQARSQPGLGQTYRRWTSQEGHRSRQRSTGDAWSCFALMRPDCVAWPGVLSGAGLGSGGRSLAGRSSSRLFCGCPAAESWSRLGAARSGGPCACVRLGNKNLASSAKNWSLFSLVSWRTQIDSACWHLVEAHQAWAMAHLLALFDWLWTSADRVSWVFSFVYCRWDHLWRGHSENDLQRQVPWLGRRGGKYHRGTHQRHSARSTKCSWRAF